MAKQGWFTTKGREGDRTVEQQMIGLDKLVAEIGGKTVLDVGCAEGLIGLKLADAGASHVLGIETIRGHVDIGRKYAKQGVNDFVIADANAFAPKPNSYDVVLLLAILHKLKNPEAAAKRFAAGAKSLVVIRLPPAGPLIVDARSNHKPHDIATVMKAAGFQLESEARGSFDEWIGYYRRVPVLSQEVAPKVAAEVPAPAPVSPPPPPPPAPAPAPASPPPPLPPVPGDDGPAAEQLEKARTEVHAPRPVADPSVDKPSDFIAHAEVPTGVDMTTPVIEPGSEIFSPTPPVPRRRFARPAPAAIGTPIKDKPEGS